MLVEPLGVYYCITVNIGNKFLNRQGFTTLGSKVQSTEEENDDPGLSLPAAKIIDKFEERLEWLQKLCWRSKKALKTSQIIPN